MFVPGNRKAENYAAKSFEMPNGNIHKGGFAPTPPEGRNLSKERILLHCCCAPCSTAIIEWMVGEGLRPGIFFSNSNIVPFREYEIRREELHRYAAAHGLETIDDEYDHTAWLAFVRRLEAVQVTEPSSPVAEPFPLVAEPVVRQSSPTIEAHRQAIRIAEMPERGPRCQECFKFRLLRAARYASDHGYTLLTTTLASSRWKDLNQVDAAGRWACETAGKTVSKKRLSPARIKNSRLSVYGDTDFLANAETFETAWGDSHKATEGQPVRHLGADVIWWGQNWRRGGLQERRNALIKEWEMYNQTFCGCEFSERHNKIREPFQSSF